MRRVIHVAAGNRSPSSTTKTCPGDSSNDASTISSLTCTMTWPFDTSRPDASSANVLRTRSNSLVVTDDLPSW